MFQRPRLTVALIMLTLVGASPTAATAQQRLVEAKIQAQGAVPVVQIIQDTDADETRRLLEEQIRKMPPSVARVLRLDPSLIDNESYLATYPTLAAFFKQHPEIRNNPGFFFENVGHYEFRGPSQPLTREQQIGQIWRDVFQMLTIAVAFITVASLLFWLLRTLVDYRRWSRVSKVQTDVHNKLMDRFTTNEELLVYIQSPAGRRFLETAPLTIDAQVRPMSAPFSRILWSMQVGVILVAAALGLIYVSGRVIEEIAQVLFGFGVVALAVGAGFIVSAAASFVLSRRLGLFDSSTGRDTADRIAS